MRALSFLFLLVPVLHSATIYPDRAAFGGNAVLDWGFLGPPFSYPSSPVTVNVSPELAVTAGMEFGNAFYRIDEGEGWYGEFLPGEHLIEGGRITLVRFEQVSGVGTQMQLNLALDDYTVTMDLFGLGGSFLGSVSTQGKSYLCFECGAAPFVGAKTSGADIYQAVFYTNHGSFAMNQVSLETGVPEPGFGYSCLAGAVALVLFWKRSVLIRGSRGATANPLTCPASPATPLSRP